MSALWQCVLRSGASGNYVSELYLRVGNSGLIVTDNRRFQRSMARSVGTPGCFELCHGRCFAEHFSDLLPIGIGSLPGDGVLDLEFANNVALPGASALTLVYV